MTETTFERDSFASLAIDSIMLLLLIAGFIAHVVGAYSTNDFTAVAAFLAAAWSFGAKWGTY